MDQQQLLQHSKKWDRTGAWIAGLCLLQCLALPFLVVAAPASFSFLGAPWLESSLLLASILVGALSFWTSYKQHQNKWPLLLGTFGILFLLYSLFHGIGPHHLESHQSLFSVIDWSVLVGGTLLIGGHLLNIHACHCFCDSGCGHEQHHHDSSDSATHHHH